MALLCCTYNVIARHKILIFCVDVQARSISTYPGVIGYEWEWSSRRGTVRWERVWLADERIVAFVIDAGVDEATVHAPGAVPCAQHGQISKNKQANHSNVTTIDLPVADETMLDTTVNLSKMLFFGRKTQPQSSVGFKFD